MGPMFCEDIVFESAFWVGVVSVVDVVMVWMVWMVYLYVCLRAQEVVVSLNRQNVCFVVQQVNVGGLCAACCSAYGVVLDDLDVFDVCGCYGWAPNGSCVVDCGADECLVCVDDGFLRLAPAASRERLEDVEPRFPLLDQVLGVVGEGVVRVQRHSEDLRGLVQGQLGAIDGDVWCMVRLVCVRCEERDRAFGNGEM